MKAITLALALAAFVASDLALAADPDGDAERALPGLAAAAWCGIKTGAGDDVARCDQGVAGALATWDPGEKGGLRGSWVLFAGSESAGTGVAVSRRLSDRVVLGAGAGVAVPYPEDERGIDLEDLRPVVGITASFW